jgi:hypothetical protein
MKIEAYFRNITLRGRTRAVVVFSENGLWWIV